MSTPTADREKALAAAIAQLDKTFGKGTIMTLDGEGLRNVESISTRSLALDRALGIGGVPKRRIIEIYGPESSGKTTICLHVIAEVQANGGTCAFIDAEHALDPFYAQKLGVKIEELLLTQPNTGEEALDIVEVLTSSGAVDFIVVDSVAALTPRAELEGSMSDNSVGLQARMMGKALRKLAGNLNRHGTSVMFTNQLREKVGVMFGSPETTPGGKALKFYASQRLDIRRIETLKDGTDAVGNKVRVKVVKNKVAPPYKQAEFEILFGEGISLEGEILDFGVEHEIIVKSGSFFSYGDLRLGQGRNNARQFLKDNTDIRSELLDKIRLAMGITQAADEAVVEPDPAVELSDAELDAALALDE